MCAGGDPGFGLDGVWPDAPAHASSRSNRAETGCGLMEPQAVCFDYIPDGRVETDRKSKPGALFCQWLHGRAGIQAPSSREHPKLLARFLFYSVKPRLSPDRAVMNQHGPRRVRSPVACGQLRWQLRSHRRAKPSRHLSSIALYSFAGADCGNTTIRQNASQCLNPSTAHAGNQPVRRLAFRRKYTLRLRNRNAGVRAKHSPKCRFGRLTRPPHF